MSLLTVGGYPEKNGEMSKTYCLIQFTYVLFVIAITSKKPNLLEDGSSWKSQYSRDGTKELFREFYNNSIQNLNHDTA